MGPDQTTYQLPPLDQVRVARWSGNSLVLIGLEERGDRRNTRYELQSWWVQVITPAVLPMRGADSYN